MRLSPVTPLGLWMAFAAALPFVTEGMLPWLGLAALPALLERAARERLLLLVRRSRVLFLLVLLVPFLTPAETGTGTAATATEWAPGGREGLLSGLHSAGRLFLLLATLSWVLARLGREGLLSALYGLLRPFKALGVPVDRFTVRLALVLDWSVGESRQHPSSRALAEAFGTPPPPAGQRLVIELRAPGWGDGVAVLLFALGLVGLLR